ncbi:MAG: ArsR/SmtB family transcription factor [Sphingobacteriia bacterium]
MTITDLKPEPRLRLERLDDVAYVLRAVSHPIRLAIIDVLDQRDSISVGELCGILSVEQRQLSHHLAKLREQRIVKTRREGQHVRYTLAERRITAIIPCIQACINK